MPALSDGGISLAILTGGMIFLTLVAKNGEFRYMVFGIRNNLCLFARIRYKMTSKMIANGRFWMGDCLLDRAVIRETGKRACFRGPIGIYSRRVPTEILPSIMGMQWFVARGEMHGSSLRRRHPSREAVPALNQVLFTQNQVLIAKKRPFYSNVPT